MLNLSNFNTSNVIYMDFMFNDCKSLLSINLSNFDTSNVESIYYLFNNDKYLMHIDISSFDEHLNYYYSFEGIHYSGIIHANKNIVLKIIDALPSGWIINF